MNSAEKRARRILVVDDESTVRETIQMLLKFDGHEVEMVDGGEAALALFEADQFDLIITDYSMQGMKGDQLAAEIRQRQPNQPIIMATAFADQFVVAGKLSVEVDYVISKPFSVTELREAIIRVLA
jgi:two-component system, cell cycle response regulator CpdR